MAKPVDMIEATPRPPAALLHGRQAVALVGTLILGVLSYQLNATMISPVLPVIASDLHASLVDIARVSSYFFLAGAIGGVVLSRWSDFVGRRRMLIMVLVVLLVGTVLCIWAPNLTVLLIGRILQGACSAAFQLAYIILREALSLEVFGTTIGVITAVSGGAAGVDGYLGAFLSGHFGFRSVFTVIFAVGALGLTCVMWTVPKDKPSTIAGKMDWWGATALSAVLICMTLLVSRGATLGWSSLGTCAYVVSCLLALAVFVLIERSTKTPLIAVQHLISRQVWPIIVTTLLALTGIFAFLNFSIVILSQNRVIGFGLSPATAALLFLAPPALIGCASAPASGWLAGHLGWLRILRGGLLLCVGALLLIAFMPRNYPVVLVGVAVFGITYYGLALTALNGLGVLLSPRDAPAALPGLNGAAFGIGASLGIAIVAPFVAKGTLAGYEAALWISVGMTCGALVTSLLIKPHPGQQL